jgi:hypothetical protein
MDIIESRNPGAGMFGVKEVLDFAKGYGLITLLKTGWEYFIFRRTERILTVRYLEEPIPELHPSADVTVRKADLEDVSKLHALFVEAGWRRPKQRLEEYIRKGYPVLIAEHAGVYCGNA